MSNFLPNTPADVAGMLETIGVKTVEELFADIPAELRLKRPLALPNGLSEAETVRKLTDLASLNISTAESVCFMGAGAYDHYIPTVLDHLLLRGDFFTAYTPYQAEISQGTLQAIYEFQSLMSGLTGMDQANASMYEGATALAEAIMMAVGQTGRKKIILPQTIHPEYRQVVESLLTRLHIQLVAVPFDDGQIDQGKLAEVLDAETAAVVVQYPNFFGCIEELESISRLTKNVNALLIVSAYPIALGMLTPPGEMGADIVTGEGQSLGAPLGFGGPYLGFIAAKTSLLRKMPGRIAGCTQDTKGRRGFVLTLQAREQHIRREKATSNICSNQALMALNATIYLSLVGAEGLRDIAYQSFQKAHYLKKELSKIPSLTFPFSVPFFNEFVVKIPEARKNLDKLAKKGIFAGVPLDRWYSNLKDHVLIAVTEKRTVEEMNRFVELLGGMLS